MSDLRKRALLQGLALNQRLARAAANGMDWVFNRDTLIKSGRTWFELVHDSDLMAVRYYELPDEDELGALYDRFLLRFTVGYIEHDHKFARLLTLPEVDPDAPFSALEPGQLVELQASLTDIEVPNGVLRDVIDIRRKLAVEGVVASDRRYRQAVGVLKAAAVLEGRSRVVTADLAWLQHILWSDPEDQAKVAEVLGQSLSGFEDEARRLLFQAKEIHAYAYRPWPDAEAKGRALLEALSKLKEIRARFEAMLDAGRDRGRDVSQLEALAEEVRALHAHLEGTPR